MNLIRILQGPGTDRTRPAIDFHKQWEWSERSLPKAASWQHCLNSVFLRQGASASCSALWGTHPVLQAAQGTREILGCRIDPRCEWSKVRKKTGLGAQRHFLKLERKKKKKKAADLGLMNSANDVVRILTGQISCKRHLVGKEMIIEKEWPCCVVN